MSLQSIDRAAGQVVNHHPFGRDLAEAAWSTELMAVLEHAGLDHGWMDGGCHAFAEGLKALIEAQAPSLSPDLAIVSRPSVTDHIVVRMTVQGEAVYADADGLASGEDIVAKMEQLERPGEGFEIRSAAELSDQEDTIDYHEIGLPQRVTRALDRALGPIDAQRLSPAWMADADRAGASPRP